MEIQKEDVANVRFLKTDVLVQEEKRSERQRAIDNAMLAGNLYKTKTTIHFVTADGPRSVTTTVWHSTQAHVVLKGGTVIPIRAIEMVR
jgi:hypothetical protein